MGYLIRQDYKGLIQSDNLAQIIGSDYALLTKAEAVAQAEVISYLTQKYNTAREFVDTELWAYGATYSPTSRIYLDATTYSATSTYALHSTALYGGNVYLCTTAIVTPEAWNAAHWQLVGAQYAIYHIDLSEDVPPATEWDYYTDYAAGDVVWYGTKTYTAISANTGYQPDENTGYWEDNGQWSVDSIDLPDGNAVFIAEDDRNQQMVNYMIDVVLYHLHSRIAPRNIPDLRVKRYDDAISWLKQCAKGDHLTAALPQIQPRQGMRNRYGGSLPKQNNNF